MSQQDLLNEFLSLPTEGQRQVVEFIAALKQKNQPMTLSNTNGVGGDPFIGMWKDRHDLSDSSAWVRDLRRCEW